MPSDNQAKEIPFTVVNKYSIQERPAYYRFALSPVPCQPAQVIFSCM